MLDALRRGSTGMVAKALFAILVISFAIWGIGPVFRNFGRGALAKVGPHEIRAEDFQRSLQNELRAISRQTGRHITPEQARAAGIDQRVLAQLMAWAAVETHADQLDLALSDKALINGLKDDPAFKDPNGNFSRIAFENVLQNMGLSERGFLALRRRDELREQVTGALINGVAIPNSLVDLVNSWRNEKRVAQFFVIDADKAVKVPEPDDAKLRETYEANKGEFTSPEFRKLGVLVLSVDDLKTKMDVTDAEIATKYEESKDAYNTPERRRLQQLAFKDKAAAEAAKTALAGGKSFGDLAKELGAKDSDIDLGLVSKDRLIDPKIGDVAFSLPKDGISDPIEGRFATVLVRVSAIEPAVIRTLADVKDQVRDAIAKGKAQGQVQSLIDQVEDGRSAGKPLQGCGRAVEAPVPGGALDRPQQQDAGRRPGCRPPRCSSHRQSGLRLAGRAAERGGGAARRRLRLGRRAGRDREEAEAVRRGEGAGEGPHHRQGARASHRRAGGEARGEGRRGRGFRRARNRGRRRPRSRRRRRSRARPSRRECRRTRSRAPLRWRRARPRPRRRTTHASSTK